MSIYIAHHCKKHL